jgi:hypothetical protein
MLVYLLAYCRFLMIAAALGMMTMLMNSCGGTDTDMASSRLPQTRAGISQEKRATNDPTVAAEKAAVTAPASAAADNKEAAQIALLRKLPQLSMLTPQEAQSLLLQLRQGSPSQRQALFDKHPLLSGMPVQQKQVVLAHLEDIVPLETKPSRLVCICKGNVTRELCVREDCSETARIFPLCDAACGGLTQSSASCTPASQCSGKPVSIR